MPHVLTQYVQHYGANLISYYGYDFNSAGLVKRQHLAIARPETLLVLYVSHMICIYADTHIYIIYVSLKQCYLKSVEA